MASRLECTIGCVDSCFGQSVSGSMVCPGNESTEMASASSSSSSSSGKAGSANVGKSCRERVAQCRGRVLGTAGHWRDARRIRRTQAIGKSSRVALLLAWCGRKRGAIPKQDVQQKATGCKPLRGKGPATSRLRWGRRGRHDSLSSSMMMGGYSRRRRYKQNRQWTTRAELVGT